MVRTNHAEEGVAAIRPVDIAAILPDEGAGAAALQMCIEEVAPAADVDRLADLVFSVRLIGIVDIPGANRHTRGRIGDGERAASSGASMS
ncbi:hypothetical protein HJA87_18910 [Rhizobium bangladeshense]|uniref:Uncharacterized protein n=1 Tax=Rhizobium bangladeshense TaxID=1138189 RepID=A0ABS7LKT3_9HYPH|nr:hypothetical protein [Rhizobium bangladeshense]MBX4873801.1 hypothetical protein [Rhizobium bangladeshense]MBX4884801.1 hypothetical protein [Rhizobium bangladeshense]MBY3591925.1 hypothetical protein [Rhizobium bangladeshense]